MDAQSVEFGSRRFQRRLCLVLGAGLWVWAGFMLLSSVRTVWGRVVRPVELLNVELPEGAKLLPGDPVYLNTERGLTRAGEVRSCGYQRALLALEPSVFTELNRSVCVSYWRTPLSAEASVNALLPPEVRMLAACQIAHDWHAQEEELARIWRPLVADLAMAYSQVLADELTIALRKHEDELRTAGQIHLQAFAAKWPAIQEHLRPILEKHLTPVLGEMITNAISDAPKVEIAMLIARGKHGEAYGRMLDWFMGYLASIPDEDRKRVNEAVWETWEAARLNPAIVALVEEIVRPIAHDEQFLRVLAEVYRDAVAENPRTTEFIQSKIVEDPRVRAQTYALLEVFAPTARNVLSLCAFDPHGATRPEVVQLIRSVTLRRRVAWLTLVVEQPDAAPLQAGALLRAEAGGPRP